MRRSRVYTAAITAILTSATIFVAKLVGLFAVVHQLVEVFKR